MLRVTVVYNLFIRLIISPTLFLFGLALAICSFSTLKNYFEISFNVKVILNTSQNNSNTVPVDLKSLHKIVVLMLVLICSDKFSCSLNNRVSEELRRVNVQLNASSSLSDEVNVQGDNCESNGRIKDQAHAGVDRSQADDTNTRYKITFKLFAYNVWVFKFRCRTRGRVFDSNVVNAIVVLQKLQHNALIPADFAARLGVRIAAFFAEIFGRKLNLRMLRVFAAVAGKSFVDFVVASPKPQNCIGVRAYFVLKVGCHVSEVFAAFFAGEKVLDVVSNATKNLQPAELPFDGAVYCQCVEQCPQATGVATVLWLAS